MESHQWRRGRPERLLLNFPREAKKEVAEMGGAASCKERGGDQCDVSSSQAVTT